MTLDELIHDATLLRERIGNGAGLVCLDCHGVLGEKPRISLLVDVKDDPLAKVAVYSLYEFNSLIPKPKATNGT